MCGRQEAQRGKSTWEPGDPKFKRHFASMTKFLPLSKPQVLRLISGKIPAAVPVSYSCEKDKTGYKALCKLATVRYSHNNLQGNRHQTQAVCRA